MSKDPVETVIEAISAILILVVGLKILSGLLEQASISSGLKLLILGALIVAIISVIAEAIGEVS